LFEEGEGLGWLGLLLLTNLPVVVLAVNTGSTLSIKKEQRRGRWQNSFRT
jgi:hypothetical protein